MILNENHNYFTLNFGYNPYLGEIFDDILGLKTDTDRCVQRVWGQPVLVYVNRSTDRFSYRYQEIVSLPDGVKCLKSW